MSAPTATAVRTGSSIPAIGTLATGPSGPSLFSRLQHRISASIDGTVSGAIDQSTRDVGDGAVRILTAAAGLALVALVGYVLFKRFLGVVIIVVVVLVGLGMLFDKFPGFQLIQSLFGALFRGGGRVAATVGKGRGPGQQAVDITRFRIVDGAGQAHDCEMVGRLKGPVPRLNDDVRVFGRRSMSGVVKVKRVVNTVSGTTVKPARAPGVMLARAAAGVLVLLLVCLATYLAIKR